MYSADENAMFCYNLYACLPLWMHRRIKEYEECYNAYAIDGVHTNESPQLYPPYREYPSTFIKEAWERAIRGDAAYTNAKEDEYQSKLKYAFDKAIEYGIIKQGSDGRFVISIAELSSKPLNFATINDVIKNTFGKYHIESLNDRDVDDKLLKFVNDYISDKSNETAEGFINEDKFYNKLCAEYPTVNNKISSNHEQSNGMLPDTEENAFKLLRKQMQLIGRLLAALTIIESLMKVIKQENGRRSGKARSGEYFKFMLYGLISAEKGRWYYFSPNNAANNEREMFTTTAKVNNNDKLKHLVDFMEIASYKEFIEVEGYGKIKASLAGEVKFIIDEIDKERRSSDDVVVTCEKYQETMNRVLKLYEEKIRRGNLTAEEAEIVEFYEELGKAATATSNLYK